MEKMKDESIIEFNRRYLIELQSGLPYAFWQGGMECFNCMRANRIGKDFACGNVADGIRLYLYENRKTRDEVYHAFESSSKIKGIGWPIGTEGSFLDPRGNKVDHMAIVREIVTKR